MLHEIVLLLKLLPANWTLRTNWTDATHADCEVGMVSVVVAAQNTVVRAVTVRIIMSLAICAVVGGALVDGEVLRSEGHVTDVIQVVLDTWHYTS